MANVFKSVYVETNTLGNCINVIELKTLPSDKVEELKRQAKEYRANLIKQEQEKLRVEQELKNQQVKKEYVRSLFIAKHYFDSLVDKGTYETTEQFEEHFEQFALGGVEFNVELAPSSYLAILERVK